MTPVLALHICAGSLGMAFGAAAVIARKGGRAHRRFGTAFSIAILIMTVLGAYLAIFVPQRASVAVAVFTFYLVATAWGTVRRKVRGVGVFEYAALVAALGSAGALLGWGLQAAHSASGLLEGSPPAPYFVFAGFGGFAALLDLKVILQGGIDGVARIRRHLWRMCFALFFVTSFFFLGQQQVMPAFMRGSPVLFVPALAPLVVMIFWLIRIRFPRWFRKNLSVP